MVGLTHRSAGGPSSNGNAGGDLNDALREIIRANIVADRANWMDRLTEIISLRNGAEIHDALVKMRSDMDKIPMIGWPPAWREARPGS